MKPLLSIISPNYNYSQYIHYLIESVLSQSYDNFEYIIVDDGSTDNSVKVIQEYVLKYPDKIILVQQENKGQTAAINAGLRLAKGEIIGWINSDDTYCKDTFEKVVGKFEKYPDADIVFGDMNAMDLSGNFIFRRRHTNFSFLAGSYLSFTRILSSNAVFWKKEAMDRNGLPDETLLCNMDGEFYSRLTIGMKVVRINSALANFRKQPYSKAAEKNSNWDQIVRRELMIELHNSYNRLSISKYIPYKFTFPIRFFFQTKRILLRLLQLHFIKQYLEFRNYRKKYIK
jgi:glycosyltransferase involved in cell wall biosynthesis